MYDETASEMSFKTKLVIVEIITIVIVLMFVLSNVIPSGNVLTKEPEGDVTAFHYDYGSYFGGYYTYELERRYDGKVSFSATGGNGVDLNIHTYVDPSCLDELADIINECIIYTWNGFNRSDNGLMDGYSFTLAARYSDGGIISAHGYGKEPVNYSAAHQALTEFFEELCERYEGADENTEFLGNIEYFIYTYRTPELGRRTYSISKNDNGTVNFVVSGDSLEESKTVDISVIQKLENLIVEKEIYKWNGFDEEKNYAVEDQGFSLMAAYENNELIRATGSKKTPEGYDLCHQALVEFFESITE